jgi:transposase
VPILFRTICGRVVPLLPPAPERRRRHPGRLRVPDRVALTGVTYVLRTGAAWRDVPTESVSCSGVTAWHRLRGWTEAGVRPRLHAALLSSQAKAPTFGVWTAETIGWLAKIKAHWATESPSKT